MKARLWRLVPGPEWERSVQAEYQSNRRFDENLEALLDALAVFPDEYSRPLISEVEDVRFATTKDVAEGYRLVAFIKMHRRTKTIELGWVAVEEL